VMNSFIMEEELRGSFHCVAWRARASHLVVFPELSN
jgi:hypothetical protein